MTKAFENLLKQNWIQCQIISICVSNYQDKNLIGIGHQGGNDYTNIICKTCADVLGIKNGDDLPKNAKELLKIKIKQLEKV